MCDDWTEMKYSTIEDAPKIAGVYFLMNGIELVYVGQSKNIRYRLSAHHRNWNCTTKLGDYKLEEDLFDGLYYLKCNYKSERKAYEDLFKEDYFPKLNGSEWKMNEMVFYAKLIEQRKVEV